MIVVSVTIDSEVYKWQVQTLIFIVQRHLAIQAQYQHNFKVKPEIV